MHVKYPRTHHLPWSEGARLADKRWSNCEGLLGKEVVVTEKMDGENTTLYNDHIHARSIDGCPHPESQSWVRGLWGSIKHDIPENWRICGENLYAAHSLRYYGLSSYFLVFSIWNRSKCLAWGDTVSYCEMLGLETVPELWRGTFCAKEIREQVKIDPLFQEGYVVRPLGEFDLNDFSNLVAKYVRKGHVQTNEHWKHKEVVPNLLE